MHPQEVELDRVRLLIEGRVQGVGFRWFVLERARSIGLAGEVRNLPQGAVEAIAEGPRRALEELRDAVRRGPPAARVARVVEEWGAGVPRFEDFRIVD